MEISFQCAEKVQISFKWRHSNILQAFLNSEGISVVKKIMMKSQKLEMSFSGAWKFPFLRYKLNG